MVVCEDPEAVFPMVERGGKRREEEGRGGTEEGQRRDRGGTEAELD